MNQTQTYNGCDMCNSQAVTVRQLIFGQVMNVCQQCATDFAIEERKVKDDGTIPRCLSNALPEWNRNNRELQDKGVWEEKGLRVRG